jgi:hypothetical protein
MILTLSPSACRLSRKYRNLHRLKSYGPLRPVTGIGFPFPVYTFLQQPLYLISFTSHSIPITYSIMNTASLITYKLTSPHSRRTNSSHWQQKKKKKGEYYVLVGSGQLKLISWKFHFRYLVIVIYFHMTFTRHLKSGKIKRLTSTTGIYALQKLTHKKRNWETDALRIMKTIYLHFRLRVLDSDDVD